MAEVLEIFLTLGNKHTHVPLFLFPSTFEQQWRRCCAPGLDLSTGTCSRSSFSRFSSAAASLLLFWAFLGILEETAGFSKKLSNGWKSALWDVLSWNNTRWEGGSHRMEVNSRSSWCCVRGRWRDRKWSWRMRRWSWTVFSFYLNIFPSSSPQVKVEDTRRAFGARLAQQVAREAQVEFSFVFSLCDVYIRFDNRLSVDKNIVANECQERFRFLLPLNFQKYALNILMNPSISTSMNHYTIIELQTCSS